MVDKEQREWAEMIKRQRDVLLAAESKKGTRAKNKPSRLELTLMFRPRPAPAVSPGKHMQRSSFINLAYPPSTTPLAELKTISIDDLRLETHHRAIQNAFEDATHNADRLALYNEDPSLSPEKVLPFGTVVAVKEPYYKSSADGGYAIRIDHPSDLVVLEASSPLIPAAFRMPQFELSSTTATSLKTAGNAAYAKKDHAQALDLYNRGVEACRHDELSLKQDILRNRALVNLNLKRFESAIEDAEASILAKSDTKSDSLSAKAYYRAGRAAHELGDFATALTNFEKALKLSPDDDESTRLERTRASNRYLEQRGGVYNLEEMSASASKQNIRLDHASYTSCVKIAPAGKRGRGLYTLQDIKAGQLILCEKAYAAAFSWEMKDLIITLNLNTNRGSAGPQATLLHDIVQKLRCNPKQGSKFLDLFAGSYSPKCKPTTVDGVTVIDTFETQAIIEHNVFGCPDVRTANESGQSGKISPSSSAGIWIMASYMNHSCDANARRAFFGDMMILHASKDIKKGEEITIHYKVADNDHQQTIKDLQSWGFKCDCPVCVAEGKTPSEQAKQRLELIRTAKAFVEHNKQSLYSTPSNTSIKRAEDIYSKLEATYSNKDFEVLPKLGLHLIGSWLGAAYATPQTPQKAVKCALRNLANDGFKIVIKGKNVKIHRKTGHVMPAVTDCAVYASHAYNFLNEVEVSKQFMDFAKETYRVLNGEMRGFEKRYGRMEGLHVT